MISLQRKKNLKDFSAKLIYLFPKGSHYFFHLWEILMVQCDFLLYQFKVLLIFTLFKMVWNRLQSGMTLIMSKIITNSVCWPLVIGYHFLYLSQGYMCRNRYLAFYFFKKETSGKGFLFLHSEYILFCEAPIKLQNVHIFYVWITVLLIAETKETGTF